MRKVLIALAIFYTLLLSLNYILGVLQTPPGYVYLGTVHYPSDYLYYLSQFTQGKNHWLGTIDLYTSEKIQPMLVWVTNVFTGHVFSLMHIPPILAYQLTVTLYTFLFFLLVIFFLEAVFPKEKEAQCIAFILLGITNLMQGMGSFFANVTEPMTRFPRIPHHMLGLVCIIFSLLLVLKWEKPHSFFVKCMLGSAMIVTSILLANISPIQWILVFCTLISSVTVRWILHKHEVKHLQEMYILPLIFLFSGLPMIVYLLRIFKTLPLAQSAAWDIQNQIRLSPLNFFKSFGPVFLLALAGLPLFCKRLTLPRILILIYTFASIALFVSPLCLYAHMTNFRFLSAVTILGESILAAYFIVHIPIGNTIARKAASWAMVLILSVLFIPRLFDQIGQQVHLDTSDSFIYLSDDAVSAYREAEKVTNEDDIVLAIWPFDVSFPALTGRRGFMGHPLLTINADKKVQEVSLFFNAQMNDAAMHKFLIDNGITYVLDFTSVGKIKKPFLKTIYQNNLLTLYNVLPY